MQTTTNYDINQELELYKAMLGAQPQSMFLMDKNKTMIGIFNATPEALAGFTVDDIVGNSILKYAEDPTSPFHQACAMLNSTFDPVFRTEMPLKFQYMILDNYFEATITKISGERILSQVRNITDTVLRIKEIEQNRRKELSIALIAGGLTSWSYDVEKRIISSTHTNNVITEDLLMDDFILLIQPMYRDIVWQMFNDIIEHKADHVHITVQVMNSAGRIQWSDVHAVPNEISSEGKVLSIIGSQKDATMEYEYNEKLQALVMQNELVLNNTNSGFVYLSSALKIGWQNVSNIFCDPQIINSFKDENMIEAICNDKSDLCVAASAIKQVIATRRQATCKYKTVSQIVLEVIARPIFNDQEQFEGIVVRIDDITQKDHSIQELAKAKEKAEQSDKLKSAFLANMSHEIRTPLNSIVGFTQLLAEEDSKESRMDYFNIIESNTEILLNLINDILDLSKIEAGYIHCENKPFDLHVLFAELMLTFKSKVRQSVVLSCEMYNEEYMVVLDRMRISQVIVNFLTNAIKFTKQGFIKMGFIPMGERLKIYVEDTGCGMTQEQIERVFDRFEKFEGFEQGTGLGTSIAKAIVDLYEGEIGVESAVGKGTTFWAILPVNGKID